MNAMLEIVVEFLKTKDVTVEVKNNRVHFGNTGNNGSWNVEVETDESGKVLSILSRLPMRLAAAKNAEFALFVARLNCGRRLGSFHFDVEDGSVVHCLSTPVAAIGEQACEIFEKLLQAALSMVDEPFPALMRAAYAEDSPPLDGRIPALSNEVPGRHQWN